MYVGARVPHPVSVYMMQPVGISSALIDQVKLMFVGHTDHIVIFPRRPVHQRHHHRRVTQTDLLIGGWYKMTSALTHIDWFNYFNKFTNLSVQNMLRGSGQGFFYLLLFFHYLLLIHYYFSLSYFYLVDNHALRYGTAVPIILWGILLCIIDCIYSLYIYMFICSLCYGFSQ